MGPVRALRLAAALLLVCVAALAANFKLYLKDGDFQLVREYKVLGDRVSFYSVERSEWEEVPLDLVDLKRTEAEIKQHQAALAEEAKVLTAEEHAERQQQDELSRVPRNPGVYLVDGQELRSLKQAESKAVTSKGRSILKIITPVPVVAGKVTVELDGERSATAVSNPEPEFYFRLAVPERFALLKLAPKKGARIVQTWNVLPVTREVLEDQQEVPILNRQLAEDIYKIWPKEPLKPGEYAVVEYTAGARNIQIWDFSYNPAVKP